MTPTTVTGGSARETPPRRAKAARIAAGTTAGVASLVLALLLTTTPERFGLSPSPQLFERVRAEDRASDAFIFVWALIALPVAGVLHTPPALARRARIGAGWALIAGYWLYVALMALVAWQVREFFPGPDAPGKNGGLFGAAILMVIGTPLFAVGSGGVFRTPGGEGARIRDHLTAVTVLCCTFIGLVTGLMSGYHFAFPRDGYPAMFLPGGILWGLLAGAALGMRVGALLTNSPDSRRRMTDDAGSFARTSTAVLACCLCVSQLGWLLPGWAVALIGLPAPYVLFVVAGRYEETVGRWVRYRQIELPKGALWAPR
ncbi:hypothetical protein [Streptomyces lomondensis]|uniref:DUF418 domain-containing protein n=1 Tax=Streptomyces lomondensis TaxID=68229 RepID=A0ABQ2X1P4_9ACTN|nr:hypothetical protein [Streptomyces lomondensis]MCF0081643.1 hypothetical protein [Streptomyces lomondensis]GGW92155.1 hypothetical protein GCM10010383_22490 [Streptomyces lomondensis]